MRRWIPQTPVIERRGRDGLVRNCQTKAKNMKTVPVPVQGDIVEGTLEIMSDESREASWSAVALHRFSLERTQAPSRRFAYLPSTLPVKAPGDWRTPRRWRAVNGPMVRLASARVLRSPVRDDRE